VQRGQAIDIADARLAARTISDSVAEEGLTEWLTTVRRHHEGTYQHCLLVTGTAVAFGLSLGLAKADIERLHSAAMSTTSAKPRFRLPCSTSPAGWIRRNAPSSKPIRPPATIS
jgi:hypothetical protein